MVEPKVVFFDVGGVLLSNGWDRAARHEAARHFDLDYPQLRERHDLVAAEFEQGEIDLDTYLSHTIFHTERPFSRADFVAYMKGRSRPIPDTLDLLAELSASGRYLLATLNNESRELNEHRITTFGLREHFSAFLSSCYLGVRKPEPAIFRIAIDVVQQPPPSCVFIDDRHLNVECAALAGMQTIHFTDAPTLRADLASAGVVV